MSHFRGYTPRPTAPTRSQIPWTTNLRTYDVSHSSVMPLGGDLGRHTEYLDRFPKHAPQAPPVVHPGSRPEPKETCIRTFHVPTVEPRPDAPAGGLRCQRRPLSTVNLSPSVPPASEKRTGLAARRTPTVEEVAHRKGVRTYGNLTNSHSYNFSHIWTPDPKYAHPTAVVADPQ
eukprot:RCo035748